MATDQQLLFEVEYALLENGNADADGTLLTTMFTTTQIVQAFNDRQRRFLKDTGLVITRRTPTLVAVPQQSRYTHPTDWIQTRRLAWENADGDISALTPTDAWELDQGLLGWPADFGTPVAWHESTLPTLTFEVEPSPADVGQIHELYVALSTALTGLGVTLIVPDEFAWAVKYGALGDLLAADGEGNDPARATYCQSRYEMGVELARVLLGSVKPGQPQGA